MKPAATIVESLLIYAQCSPDVFAFRFLGNGESETDSLTFAGLHNLSSRIAACLERFHASRERVLLLVPQDLRFVTAFFGCLKARAVPVPMLVPRPNRPISTLVAIARDAKPRVIFTTREIRQQLEPALGPHLPNLIWQCLEDIEESAVQWSGELPVGQDLALLQYTSGSTGSPKGVMVTHANLIHNEEAIKRAFGHSDATITAGWLPMYHDMGLIGHVLQPVYHGVPAILMPPVAFLQKPIRWLRMITTYRVASSGGPNFAYELCVDKIPEAQRRDLDLSSWRLAFNGSEPVRASTIDRFCDAFGPYGFSRRSIYPCYGMAEATLIIAGPISQTRPKTLDVDADQLAAGRVSLASDRSIARRLVSCGRPWNDMRAAIVDADSCVKLAEGEVGEIWISGGSVAAGYFGQPEKTEAIFGARVANDDDGPFMRTGDLGFIWKGEVFVTGRLKDLIIIRGRNHYPQDIEQTAQNCSDHLRSGGGAAFSIEAGAEEQLVVVHDLERTSLRADYDRIAAQMREAIAVEHGIAVHMIVLTKPGGVPKTSSGKLRRSTCRDLFNRGELPAVYNGTGYGRGTRYIARRENVEVAEHESD